MILVSYYWLKFLVIVWMPIPYFSKVKMCFKGFPLFALIEDDQKVKCGVVDRCQIIHILRYQITLI